MDSGKLKNTFSIRNVIMTLMIGEIFLAILITGWLWYSNGRASVQTLSKNLSEEITKRVEDRISNFLNVAREQATSQAELFSTGLIDPNSSDKQSLTLEYQKRVLERKPHIATLYVGVPDGELFGYQKDLSGNLIRLRCNPNEPGLYEYSSDGNTAYDPDFNTVERPWFSQAVEKKAPGWTPVYKFGGIPQLGLSAFETFVENDSVKIISVCDLTLGPIHDFLSNLNISDTGQTAIFEPNGLLIASSAPNPIEEIAGEAGEENQYVRVRASDSNSPILTEAYQALTSTLGDVNSWPKKGSIQIDGENDEIFITWRSIQLEADQQWVSLVAIPRRDLTSEVRERTQNTALVFLGLIIFTIPLVWRTAEGITRPLRELNRGMDKIARFENEGTSVRSSRLRELNEMQSRMERMRHALTSFEKYVPSRVVRQLVLEDRVAVPGMEEAKACIFFSDIIGFTDVAETLDPDKLVQLGGEYLEGMSQHIHAQSGVVDKFIGDAIMAFWIAEVDGARVTSRACRAALSSQESLHLLRKDWRTRSLPALRARIGLHTGPVRVGNIGSTTRLNYTILGDSVNLASRLEGLNKVYGTSIMVSEEVKNIAEVEFHFRILDRVSVKGRRQGGAVYELVDHADRISAQQREISELHEEALRQYTEGRFIEARSLFSEISKISPEDKPAKVLEDRCHWLIDHPPEEWSGTIAIDRNFKDNG